MALSPKRSVPSREGKLQGSTWRPSVNWCSGSRTAHPIPSLGRRRVRFSPLERGHGGAVVAPEYIHGLGWRACEVEHVRIPDERHIVRRDTSACKSLDHVVLDSPRHGADEPLRWWRRVGSTDFQDLRDRVGSLMPVLRKSGLRSPSQKPISATHRSKLPRRARAGCSRRVPPRQ
jgi:hypothetical protein